MSGVRGRSGRRAVEQCLNGHSIAEVGRGVSGRCNACRRQYERDRKKPGYASTPKPIVPTERLRRLAGSRDVAAAMWFSYRQCDLKSAQSHVARLWTRPYISIDTADRWCLALGHDLAEVFPEVYLYEERHCGHCDRPVYTEPDGVLCPVCGEELPIGTRLMEVSASRDPS